MNARRRRLEVPFNEHWPHPVDSVYQLCMMDHVPALPRCRTRSAVRQRYLIQPNLQFLANKRNQLSIAGGNGFIGCPIIVSTHRLILILALTRYAKRTTGLYRAPRTSNLIKTRLPPIFITLLLRHIGLELRIGTIGSFTYHDALLGSPRRARTLG